MSSPEDAPPSCPNCGTPAPDNYCPNCGQPQRERITSAPTLLRDVASTYFTFDARLWRTLKPLLVAPGRLTKEYVQGHRRRYSRPSRVYVAASIVFFFTLSFTSTNLPSLFYDPPGEAVEEAGALADTTAQQRAFDSPEDSLRVQKMQAAMDSLRATGIDINPDALWLNELDHGEKIKISSEGIRVEDPESRTSINIEADNFDRDKLVAAFIDKLPTLMFVMLPVFAFLLKLLYVRRSRFYIEHLIFAFHTHAFAFLVLTPVMLGDHLLPDTAGAILKNLVVLGLLYYLYRALRVVYEQSRRKTVLKFVLLLTSYGFTLAVGFLVTIILTAALMQM